MTNLYETLGVDKNAGPEEIKKAYRKKARDNHPDNGGDHAKMTAITRAYAVLSDDARRAEYDQTGNTDQAPTIDARVRTRVAQIVNELLFSNSEADSIAELIRLQRKHEQGAYDMAKANLVKRRRQVEKLSERILKRPEADLIGFMVEQSLAAVSRDETGLELEHQVSKMALDLLEEYQFSEKVKLKDGFYPFGITIMANKL